MSVLNLQMTLRGEKEIEKESGQLWDVPSFFSKPYFKNSLLLVPFGLKK